MLSPKPQLSLRNAKDYFREHLCVGDYYAQGQQVAGEWLGLGAENLGLKGKVGEAEFLRMCEGLHPKTGERLTLRMNSNRQNEEGQSVANRRVFYDFTISPPKSVSIVALLQDDRIFELHDRAVKHAMTELEKFAETRVRKSGERGERVTGNVVAATFRHDTSRELDPHLHTHCVVLNGTFDQQETRWKALEVHGMYRAQKFAENLYYHELSKGLRSLGYEIQNNRRDFEIKGVPVSAITRFSKRHQQIDEEAQKRIEREGGDVNSIRRHVARDARKRKIKDSTTDKLRPSWVEQLSEAERNALAALRSQSPVSAKANVDAVVAWADEHLFERRSVVRDFELLSAALARGRGEDFDLATLHDAIDRRGYIREEASHRLTSREVLRCELDVVLAAKNGRRRHGALNPDHAPASSLSPEQKAAVGKILQNRDFITLFRGGAGTGKSFTLKEVERGLSAAGRPVVVLAPQRQQVRDLQADGLAAETLARFLETKQLTNGAVVIVDEAGQIGARQIRQLIQLVQANAGRIILSGDTRQHGAVAASDALRAIEKHAGLKPAVIQTIRRQDPKLGASAKERGFIRAYRAAVKAAAKGKITESFDRLEKMDCIRELPNHEERRSAVANEFIAAVGRKEKTLVVAQTREEVREINDTIRQKLRAEGKLDADKILMVCQPVDLGEAEKRDPRFYHAGQQVFFIKAYGRFKKGDLCEITSANERGLALVKDGRRSSFSYRYADRIVVGNPQPHEIAAGDRLQMKFNGKSVEGAPINNGELVTVRCVRADGAIIVEDDAGDRKTLSPAQRLFMRGYAVTSYASQGKTVDTVIVADATNRGATNAEQWYVTISRGRKRALVFTSEKEALRKGVERSGSRELAMELKAPAAAKTAAVISMERKSTRWRHQARALIDRIRRQRFIAKLNLKPKPEIASRIRVKP